MVDAAICNDPIVERVRAKLLERSDRGCKKYRTTLANANLSRLQTLIHLQEELLDAANYLEKLIDLEREGDDANADQS